MGSFVRPSNSGTTWFGHPLKEFLMSPENGLLVRYAREDALPTQWHVRNPHSVNSAQPSPFCSCTTGQRIAETGRGEIDL